MAAEVDKVCPFPGDRWQSAELRAMGLAVDGALAAEGVAPDAAEPESELPSGEEALEARVAEVEDAVAQLLRGAEGELAADASLRRVPLLLAELLLLLKRTTHLAEVRGQRAQRLEADLARARAATRSSSEVTARRESFEARRDSFEMSRRESLTDPASAREERPQDVLEGAAARLTLASRTLKDKEWELAQARQKVDQLERDKSRQDQRIRELETIVSRVTGLCLGAEGEVARLAERLQSGASTPDGKVFSPEKRPARSAASEPQPPPAPPAATAVDAAGAAATAATATGATAEEEAVAASSSEGASERRRIRFPPADQVECVREYEVDGGHAAQPWTASEPAAEASYLLDNSGVRSSTKGLSFRRAKDMSAKDGNNLAVWGSTVRGVDEGDGWVRVGERYLPKDVQGVPVLRLQQGLGAGGLEDARRSASRAVPPITGMPTLNYSPPPVVEESQPQARPAGKPALPTDMRSLGKLLTGHAIKTPRR